MKKLFILLFSSAVFAFGCSDTKEEIVEVPTPVDDLTIVFGKADVTYYGSEEDSESARFTFNFSDGKMKDGDGSTYTLKVECYSPLLSAAENVYIPEGDYSRGDAGHIYSFVAGSADGSGTILTKEGEAFAIAHGNFYSTVDNGVYNFYFEVKDSQLNEYKGVFEGSVVIDDQSGQVLPPPEPKGPIKLEFERLRFDYVDTQNEITTVKVILYNGHLEAEYNEKLSMLVQLPAVSNPFRVILKDGTYEVGTQANDAGLIILPGSKESDNGTYYLFDYADDNFEKTTRYYFTEGTMESLRTLSEDNDFIEDYTINVKLKGFDSLTGKEIEITADYEGKFDWVPNNHRITTTGECSYILNYLSAENATLQISFRTFMNGPTGSSIWYGFRFYMLVEQVPDHNRALRPGRYTCDVERALDQPFTYWPYTYASGSMPYGVYYVAEDYESDYRVMAKVIDGTDLIITYEYPYYTVNGTVMLEDFRDGEYMGEFDVDFHGLINISFMAQ